MGRKATGAKPGQKSDLTAEQEELIQSFSDRFRTGGDNGTLYTEVTSHWLEDLDYGGLETALAKKGFSPSDLGLDKNLATLQPEELKLVEKARQAARRIVRDVRRLDQSCCLAGLVLISEFTESRQCFQTPLQCPPGTYGRHQHRSARHARHRQRPPQGNTGRGRIR